MMMERKSRALRVTSTFFWIHIPFITHIAFRYFGRAKDLPGVRELFQSRKKEEEEENQVFAFYKKFLNQGPVYYGDLDDNDQNLLHYERQAEVEGMLPSVCIMVTLKKLLRLGGGLGSCSQSP